MSSNFWNVLKPYTPPKAPEPIKVPSPSSPVYETSPVKPGTPVTDSKTGETILRSPSTPSRSSGGSSRKRSTPAPAPDLPEPVDQQSAAELKKATQDFQTGVPVVRKQGESYEAALQRSAQETADLAARAYRGQQVDVTLKGEERRFNEFSSPSKFVFDSDEKSSKIEEKPVTFPDYRATLPGSPTVIPASAEVGFNFLPGKPFSSIRADPNPPKQDIFEKGMTKGSELVGGDFYAPGTSDLSPKKSAELIGGSALYVGSSAASGFYEGGIKPAYYLFTKPGQTITGAVDAGVKAIFNPGKTLRSAQESFDSNPVKFGSAAYASFFVPTKIVRGYQAAKTSFDVWTFDRNLQRSTTVKIGDPYIDQGAVKGFQENLVPLEGKAGQRTIWGELADTTKVLSEPKSPTGLPPSVARSLSRRLDLPEGKAGVDFPKTTFSDQIRYSERGTALYELTSKGMVAKGFGETQKPLGQRLIRAQDTQTGKMYNIPENYVLRRLQENPNLQVLGQTNKPYLISADIVPGTSYVFDKVTDLRIKYGFQKQLWGGEPGSVISAASTPRASYAAFYSPSPQIESPTGFNYGSIMGEEPITSTSPSFNIVSLEKSASSFNFKQNQITEATTFVGQSSGQRSRQKQSTGQIQIPDVIQQPIQVSDFFTPSRPVPRPPVTRPSFRPPETPIKTPIFIFPTKSTKTSAIAQRFEVFTFKGGELKRIGGLFGSTKEAAKFGAGVVRTTPRASFKVVRAGSRTPEPVGQYIDNRFFTPAKSSKRKGFFVEKTTYRIDSPGELAGITMKGRQAQRAKKSSFSLWGK